MDASELLSQITVPTPCPMDWKAMRGDDRVRFCAACGKHVYNLSAMTEGETLDLIHAKCGEFCGQLYRRPDGSLVTADCRQPEPPPRRWQFHIRSIMAIVAALAAALGLTRLLLAGEPADPPPAPEPPPPASPGPTHTGGKVCIPRTVMQAIENRSSGRLA